MGKLKWLNRSIAVLLLLTLFIPGIFAMFVSADTPSTGGGSSEARYTQKIVSVVYDNSGSMQDTQERIPAARYSLSMLMSMLGSGDIMTIVPMNKSPEGGIPVDLSNPDRDMIVTNILKNPLLTKEKASGGTPPESMDEAVNILKDHGLKDHNNLMFSEPDKEYWLVILTDGQFKSIMDPSVQAGYVEDAIKEYPTLNTVYVSFGSGAMDISKESVLEKYPITTYCKVPEQPTPEDENDLVTVMQKISNQISGRYPLSTSQYDANGKTVTIDLSTIPFSLTSMSVVAQDCGAMIVSANYVDGDNAKHKTTLSKVSTIRPDSKLNLKNGCAFEVTSDSYLYKGSLVLEFDNEVKEEQLSIFAEPALNISTYTEAYIDGQWTRVDIQYINSTMREGQKIKVGYEVHEQATNSIVDLGTVFGNVTSKVTYNQTTYQIGEEIPLVLGTKDLSVEVSVLDGAYTLRKSDIIYIQKDPSFYRIEVEADTEIEGADKIASAKFTVYVDNEKATVGILKDYKCTATAKRSDGTVIFEKRVTPAGDGTITIDVEVDSFVSDKYTISLEVISPMNLSRSCSAEIRYTAIESHYRVEVSGDTDLSGDVSKTTPVFTVFIDNVQATRDMLSGYTCTATATLSDGTILFEKNVSPASDGSIPVEIGINTLASEKYTVSLKVTSPTNIARSNYIEIKYTAIESYYRVEVEGEKEIEGTSPKASAVFTVYINNIAADRDTLKDYTCTLIATRSDGTVIFEKTAVPEADGRIPVELAVNTNEFDCYRLALKVVSSQGNERSNYLDVTYVPSSLDLSVSGAGKLSVTQYDLGTNTNGFVFVLTSNGQPFPIANTVTAYKLLVGGVDVTKYATVSVNTLTYIPTSESLGALVNEPGTKTVELIISSASRPVLDCSAQAELDIVKTVYTVEALDSDTKDIDRFDLKNSQAVLYFTVKRDGVPLSFDELKALYDKGEIKIESTPLFSFFLFPAAIEKSVEEVNGTAAIAVRSKCDMHPFLDWHLSAFISGGEKPITVSYLDASGVDNFFVVESSVWQHILRITLLFFDIIKYALIICYLLGFFIAKPLPRGVFVEFVSASARTVQCSLTYINMNRRKKFPKFIGNPVFKWHTTTRLNPLKYWKDQSTRQCPNYSGMRWSFSDGNIIAKVTDADALYDMFTASDVIETIKEAVNNERPSDVELNYKLSDLFTQYNPQAKTIDSEIIIKSDALYGYYEERVGRRRMKELDCVVVFLEL